MITYTTLMGFASGMGILLVVQLGRRLLVSPRAGIVSFDGWALSFAGLGAILTVLGGHMSVAWPLQNPERFKNFMFGEPVVVLGVLLLSAGFFLWRRGDALVAMLGPKGAVSEEVRTYLATVLRPVVWIVFGLGLVLAACAAAALRYEVFASAPPQEPLLGTLPKSLVNLPLCALYVLPAVGCLLAPLAVIGRSRGAMAVTGVTLSLTGLGWLAVAVLVYYTHVGMDFNFRG
ncbi:DUF981 family protein [Kribbella sp. NPDC048915]|uniref:DUF981 family protein n=1 Tax=Kribbella sp. NPDC048915 TaxID=3155148 RepID=UPI0034012ADE